MRIIPRLPDGRLSGIASRSLSRKTAGLAGAFFVLSAILLVACRYDLVAVFRHIQNNRKSLASFRALATPLTASAFTCEDALDGEEALLECLAASVPMDGSFLQRHVVGASRIISAKYYAYRATGWLLPLGLLSSDMEMDIVEELNRRSSLGLGGLLVTPSLLVEHSDSATLADALTGIKKRFRKQVRLHTRRGWYSISITPLLFMDWNFSMHGVNADIMRLVYGRETDHRIIDRLPIDGIFGPDVDFQNYRATNLVELRGNISGLSRAGRICFLKHFGLRKEYFHPEYDYSTSRPDLHLDRIRVATPMAVFLTEDIVPFQELLVPENLTGVMVGHHFLECIDDRNQACLSPAVRRFIEDRLPHCRMIISDSMDMGGLLGEVAFGEVLRTSPADLILTVSQHLYDATLFSRPGTNLPPHLYQKILVRILLYKYRYGMLEVTGPTPD